MPEYSNGRWRLIIVGDNLSKDYASITNGEKL
jgi:hypothetical protein